MITHYFFIISVILVISLIYITGIICAINAIMTVRTSQGAIAWAISLITVPFFALPFYFVFGRSRFYGYAEALSKSYRKVDDFVRNVYKEIKKFEVVPDHFLIPLQKTVKTLTNMSFIKGNRAELLIDGEAIYYSMLNAIKLAEDYVLVQFYIVRDDSIGQKFRDSLVEKAKEGVRIYFMYDEFGSYYLSQDYIDSLIQNGIQVTSFYTRKGRGNRFQINFRNHRKVLVVDGKKAFVGGLNLGEEYLGNHPKFGPWRDTHIVMEGPCVQCVQISFAKDWYWAKENFPEMLWRIFPVKGADQKILILPTGPEQKLRSASLFILDVINLAKKRLWIASAYFVPDGTIISALQTAALRGVDVRILLPDHVDHLLVYLCSFSFYNAMESAGVRLYRYKTGFMHQKVFLADDLLAGVGTVNLDNRSLYLNFEITAMFNDRNFVRDVEKMLIKDFKNSYLVNVKKYMRRSFYFRFIVRLSRLFAPIL